MKFKALVGKSFPAVPSSFGRGLIAKWTPA